MFRKKKRRAVPGLNTTSTADISFMLLIFFLVTTSMDSDKGLGRQLPPLDPEEQQEIQDVDRRKIITIHLMKDGVTADDVPTKVDDDFRKQIRHFIVEKGPKHIIELQIDRNSEYDDYFALQNQIVRAYKEVRNAAANKRYGIDFKDCDEDMRDKILKMYPQRIQETTNELSEQK